MDNANLLLLSASNISPALSGEQLERREIIYRMLVSLFEKACIILYFENMKPDANHRWMSWEDDMTGWCRKEEFVELPPNLLEGADDAFSRHIFAIAKN